MYVGKLHDIVFLSFDIEAYSNFLKNLVSSFIITSTVDYIVSKFSSFHFASSIPVKEKKILSKGDDKMIKIKSDTCVQSCKDCELNCKKHDIDDMIYKTDFKKHSTK